jgi:pyroglutamyl-peptidase
LGPKGDRPLLLTGFGPFDGVPDNPSAAVVGALEGSRVRGVPVVGVTLPVSYARARHALDRALVRHRPRARLHLGVAPLRRTINLERVARPGDIGGVLDIDGRAPVPAESPPQLTTGVNTSAVLRALAAANLPARVSRDAGRYLCNAVYGWSLASGPAVPTLFVHLPPVGARRGALTRWTVGGLTDAAMVVAQCLLEVG